MQMLAAWVEYIQQANDMLMNALNDLSWLGVEDHGSIADDTRAASFLLKALHISFII